MEPRVQSLGVRVQARQVASRLRRSIRPPAFTCAVTERRRRDSSALNPEPRTLNPLVIPQIIVPLAIHTH
jgi:hypothetical protein